MDNLKASQKRFFMFFNEIPLKLMENVFYFTLKALFAFKIFKFLSWLFGYVGRQPDKKVKVNFKISDVTTWETNNCNKHIIQHLKM